MLCKHATFVAKYVKKAKYTRVYLAYFTKRLGLCLPHTGQPFKAIV